MANYNPHWLEKKVNPRSYSVCVCVCVCVLKVNVTAPSMSPAVCHPDDHGADHLHQVPAAHHRPAEREPLGQQGGVHAVHGALHWYAGHPADRLAFPPCAIE